MSEIHYIVVLLLLCGSVVFYGSSFRFSLSCVLELHGTFVSNDYWYKFSQAASIMHWNDIYVRMNNFFPMTMVLLRLMTLF